MGLLTFAVVIGGLVFAGAVGGAVWLMHHAAQMRTRKIAEYHLWASQHGFQYWPHDPSALAISSRSPLSNGNGRQALDVFRGRYRDAHLHCFEVRYHTSSTDSTTTYYHQVVAISLPALRPLLDVRHQNFLTRRFDKGVDFGDPVFGERFRIESPSAPFARDVLHPAMREWMLADWRAAAFNWRFEGSWLMAYRSGHLDLRQVFACADFLHEVLERVPEHVWSDQ